MSRIWVEILDVIQMGAAVVSDQERRTDIICYLKRKVFESHRDFNIMSSIFFIMDYYITTTECQKSGLKS